MSSSLKFWLGCGVVVGLVACGSSNSGSLGIGNGAGAGAGAGFPGTGGFGGLAPGTGGGFGAGGSLPPASGGTAGSNGGSSATSGGAGGVLGGTGGASGPGNPDAGFGNDASCFPSVTDYTAAGPFMPTSGDVASVQCTIFRPTTLGANGCKNPVIVWGNGTFNTPANYTDLFNHWASHGFVVAAADTSNSGSGMEMLTCLKYMIDQSTTSGTPYSGTIDTDHIASAGYSQGGAGCLEAGIDPRFVAIAAVSPFIVLPLGGYDTSSVMKQVHPLFMISGSADTVAVPAQNQQPIFDQAPVPIVWATHAGSTHLEVLGNGGAYAGPLTAWFRYKLMGDPAARDVFEKPACTLCSAQGWTVQFNGKWM